MSEEKNVPKLRFPGFTEPWEQRKFGDIFSRRMERNLGQFDNTRWISVAKMYFQNPDKVTSNNIDTRTYVMHEGDIAFEGHPNQEYRYGRFVANDIGDGVISELFPIYQHITAYDNNYWKYAIQIEAIMAPKLLRCIEISYTSSNKLDEKFFLEESIMVPTIKEQQKIGTFFKSLDRLITLHQRKLGHVKDLKKSMLQKMFPKNGELYPEVRFPGFTAAWEQRKLGDMGSTYTGLSGKTKEDFGHGEAKFITYMNVFTNPVADLQMTESVEIDSKQNSVKAGDVFFTTSSETPEEVGMSCVMTENIDNIYLNSFCFGYRPTEKFDLSYLAYVLRAESFRKEMTFLAQGISRYNISKNKVMEVEIPVPSLDEQSEVGAYFSNLDHLITLHQRELDHLQLLKKGMLQQMFV